MTDDHTPVAPAHITTVFEQYADLMSAGDTEGILALFAPEAVLLDPVTGPAHQGHEAIRRWVQESFEGNGGHVDLSLDGAVRVAGRWGAAALTAMARNDTTTVRVETLDVMEFDESGLVVRLDAYWGPTNLRVTGGSR